MRKFFADVFAGWAYTLQPEITIPSRMNHDKAVESINKQTEKSKATFFFRLVQGLKEEDIDILQKYVERRQRKAGYVSIEIPLKERQF